MTQIHPRHRNMRLNHTSSTGARPHAHHSSGRSHNHVSEPATRFHLLLDHGEMPQDRQHSRQVGSGSQVQSAGSGLQGVTSMESEKNCHHQSNNSAVDQAIMDPRGDPIFFINGPDTMTTSSRPSAKPRPENTYRGKNIVKKLVQNKKLQAILLDKNPYKERKKAALERPLLRQGMGKPIK